MIRGALIPGYIKESELSGLRQSIVLVAHTYMDPDDYWYVGVRNTESNDDIRTYSASLTTQTL